MIRYSMTLFAGLLPLFVGAANAQSPDPARLLTAEKMWALKRLGDPAITPDGRTAVVPVTSYDIGENKGLTDLWLVPVAGGEARQLTSDKASDNQPTVSPDGKWIAFISKRGDDGENQVYVPFSDTRFDIRLFTVVCNELYQMRPSLRSNSVIGPNCGYGRLSS